MAGSGDIVDGKAPGAFRTIREVSEEIGVPAHVLRFWETRFPQLKPLQRGGNRRYYRPADVELAAALHILLHKEGMTVKGVQKLIQAHGAARLPELAKGGVLPVPEPVTEPVTDESVPPAAPPSLTPDMTLALRRLRERLADALVA